MEDAAPFFVVRDGFLWACWLDGRAAIRLGEDEATASAMNAYLESIVVGETTAGPEETKELVEPETSRSDTDDCSGGSPIRPQNEYERLENRFETSVPGVVRSGSGRREVIVTDLSEHGCQFNDATMDLRTDTAITVKIGPIGPIDAIVRWRRGPLTGAKFVSPLYPSVMQHIVHHFDLRSGREPG